MPAVVGPVVPLDTALSVFSLTPVSLVLCKNLHALAVTIHHTCRLLALPRLLKFKYAFTLYTF
jgi:hypothetical protein